LIVKNFATKVTAPLDFARKSYAFVLTINCEHHLPNCDGYSASTAALIVGVIFYFLHNLGAPSHLHFPWSSSSDYLHSTYHLHRDSSAIAEDVSAFEHNGSQSFGAHPMYPCTIAVISKAVKK
jgi:hypothetical protein